MAIYNTEQYLDESINSVINQSIGFENNIQLILVDDGSADNSLKIAEKYQQQYPNNIIVLSQENQGPAVARNNGLKYIQGKYVNFLDSDDYLSKEVLKEVDEFFNKHYDEVDLVAIPIKYFDRRGGDHRLNDKFKTTRVIDLTKELNSPQLSASSSFFKNNLFNKFEFSTKIISSEDSLMINKMLLEKRKYGAISNVYYYYRKRYDNSSTIDVTSNKKEYFTDKLKFYYMELINTSIAKYNRVPAFIQYLMAYDLQWLLKQHDLSILETEIEIEEFWYYLNKVLYYIEDYVILKNNYITNPIFVKSFFVLKNKKVHTEVINNKQVIKKSGTYTIDNLNNHKFWIDIVEIRNNSFNISGFLNSMFEDNFISIEARKETIDGDISYFSSKQVKYNTRKNVIYLSKTWQYKHNFDIRIPVLKKEIFNVKLVVNYHKDGDNTNFNKDNIIPIRLLMDFTQHAKLSQSSTYFSTNSNIVILHENSFNVAPYNFKRLVKHELHDMKSIFSEKKAGYKLALLLRFMYLIIHPLIRNPIYLFMDRQEVADDNAEHLYKYALKQNDNINKFYVVLKDTNDFRRLSKIGNVVPFGSFKHKLLFLLCDKVISSYPEESVINPFFIYDRKNNVINDERNLYSGLTNTPLYFLQHGVTKDNISTYLKKYDKNVSLILTVSDKEHDSFLDEGYNYDEIIIQTLGFPRHDNLENKRKKKILFIPTWRSYLENDKDLFLASEYFKQLNNILNNESLINLVDEKGYEIIFRPHPRLNYYISNTNLRYIDLFDINDKIYLSKDESYQELFSEASLLITDYSSVFFDFAYLKKPVIYYHYANDYHHAKGYFDYETMGFGEVIFDEEKLLDKITYYLENNCTMEEEYIEKVNSFFKYNDKNNSERVYNWICKH
ncbi:hypothetical protein NL43_05940 [Methanosphaera sp. WGK6]|nr:hypothetical protein NL43_05940 [Methanosphaera sp. WGK6]